MSLPAVPFLALVRRMPAAQRERVGWCVLIVVAAHALALALPSREAAVARATPVAARLVQVRQVPAIAAPRAAALADEPVAAERRLAQRSAGGRSPSTARITKSDGGDAELADADAIYLPRALLTMAPKPRAPVVVDYPYFDGELDHYTGEFDLFIDDTGGVVRVVNATPDLPGILGQAVREAFLAARFSPGEVDGRPVRSRLRIEVTFDSRRQPSS